MNRYCIVIPAYNCGEIIISVIDKIVPLGYPVVIVNDGSNELTTSVLKDIDAKQSDVTVVHREINGGKGAAVKDGIRWAHTNGFSHALQVDSDGQHNLDDIPKFIETSQKSENSMILGAPVFSEEAPLGRKIGRKISVFWVHLETLSTAIQDPLFGFRVYPVEPAFQLIEKRYIGNFMEFDPEIAVKLYWKGLSVINIPSKVTYDDSIPSHFNMLKDNLRISFMHSRLFSEMLFRIAPLLWRKLK